VLQIEETQIFYFYSGPGYFIRPYVVKKQQQLAVFRLLGVKLWAEQAVTLNCNYFSIL